MSEQKACCQICERIISIQFFTQHSKICKEMAEAKQDLDQSKENLARLIEQALSLKSSLSSSIISQR